ncbi:MAG: acetoacetate decarboxylase family protein [Dehalococcoidia bacterium]
MPLSGIRDVGPLLAEAPLMANFATEPWPLPGVRVLQVIYEIRQGSMVDLLPPALHPTIPPTLVFAVTHCPESSVGPFTMAEVRVGCRAGARPRGFCPRTYVDSAAAATELRERWGFSARVAAVSLKAGYDRVHGLVIDGGETVLDVSLQNPEPISGADIQYLPAMNLVRTMREGAEISRIVQVDADFTFHKADRGKPLLTAFDAAAWLLDGADPWWGVSASQAVADMQMPTLRYALDPRKPATEGMERL